MLCLHLHPHLRPILHPHLRLRLLLPCCCHSKQGRKHLWHPLQLQLLPLLFLLSCRRHPQYLDDSLQTPGQTCWYSTVDRL
jgi:hypothetical protein